MISEEKLKELAEMIGKAIPEGEALQVFSVVPRVGFGDSEARPVMGFVFGDPEDFARLTQVINRGVEEYRMEYGVLAAFERKPAAVSVNGGSQPSLQMHEA